MNLQTRLSRRTVVKAAAASTVLGAPGLLMAQPAAVKIGLVHPVSGGLAFGGAQGRLGCQIAIDEINAAGGIKSMGGAKVEALMGDSQSRPEIGVSEVERLNQAGADCFVGCYSSGIALPATQAAAKYNTPFMVDVGVSDLIVNRGLKNVFRLAPGFGKCTDDAIMALGDVNKAAGNPAKKVVIVHEESEFGTGTAKLLAGKLPSIGMEAAEIIKHANPTRDFSNIALRIRSMKPEIVMMVNYPNEYKLLSRTLYQQRIDLVGMFSVLGGGFNYAFLREQPEVMEHMMDFNHWYNPRHPRAQAMRKMLADQKKDFTFEVYCGYNSVKCYVEAVERAGTADRAKVIAALESSTWSDHFMPYGATKFVNGQNVGGRAALLQATKDDISVVWPNEFSDAKPVFPRPKRG
jgi:branched-chain amino acid transport system substrate-binding protein